MSVKKKSLVGWISKREKFRFAGDSFRGLIYESELLKKKPEYVEDYKKVRIIIEEVK